MTKFKVGDKVRITGLSIFGANHIGELGAVKQVDTLLCTGGYGLYVVVDGLSRVYEYSAVEHAPTKNQRITALESEVAELKAKVEALEKAHLSGSGTVYLHGKPIGKIDAIAALSKSPNRKRKAIIAEAKAFVADVTSKNHRNLKSQDLRQGAWFVSEKSAFATIKADFYVNKKKRTVTALIRNLNNGDVRSKAVAKCAPDDVFNADIGKAIALGRALGLDVSRFEQAVKPTEVVVGHVVSTDDYRGVTHVDKVFTIGKHDGSIIAWFDEGKRRGGDLRETSGKGTLPKVIDDTEAQY